MLLWENTKVNNMLVNNANNSICVVCEIIKLRETPKVYTTTYVQKCNVIPELIALGIVKTCKIGQSAAKF